MALGNLTDYVNVTKRLPASHSLIRPPSADKAIFHVRHITHDSAVTFHTFHSAFYLRHSACHNSAFYQQLSVWLSVCMSVCDVHGLWPSGWMDEDESWHGVRSRPRPHCVRWGRSYCSPKGNYPSNFRPMYCGQTAGWIKMPLGTEVNSAQATLC